MDMSIESFILGKLLYVDLMEASQLATDTSTVLLHLWNLVSTVVEEGLGITVGLTCTECNTTSLGCLNALQIHKVTAIFDLVNIIFFALILHVLVLPGLLCTDFLLKHGCEGFCFTFPVF